MLMLKYNVQFKVGRKHRWGVSRRATMPPRRRAEKKLGWLPEPRLSDTQIARRLFLTGCALLPVIWAVAVVRYRRVLFTPYDAEDELRRWVRLSAGGLAVSVAAFAVWTAIFQMKMEDYGLDFLLVV